MIRVAHVVLLSPLLAAPPTRPQERVFEYSLAESLEGVCARASGYCGVAPRFEHVAASVRDGLDRIEAASRLAGRPARFVECGRTVLELSSDDGVNVLRFVPRASDVARERVGHALRTDVHVRDGEVRGFDVTLYGGDVRWHVASSSGWRDETDLGRRICHDLGFALGLRHRDVWMNGLACLPREPVCRKEWRLQFPIVAGPVDPK